MQNNDSVRRTGHVEQPPAIVATVSETPETELSTILSSVSGVYHPLEDPFRILLPFPRIEHIDETHQQEEQVQEEQQELLLQEETVPLSIFMESYLVFW